MLVYSVLKKTTNPQPSSGQRSEILASLRVRARCSTFHRTSPASPEPPYEMLSQRHFLPASASVLALIPASARDFPLLPRIQQTPCFSYQRSHSTELTKSSDFPRNSLPTHLCSILPNSRAPTSGVKIPLIRSGSISYSRAFRTRNKQINREMAAEGEQTTTPEYIDCMLVVTVPDNTRAK